MSNIEVGQVYRRFTATIVQEKYIIRSIADIGAYIEFLEGPLTGAMMLLGIDSIYYDTYLPDYFITKEFEAELKGVLND